MTNGEDGANRLQLLLLQTDHLDDAIASVAFLRSLPSVDSYPYCMDNSAGLAAAAIAWGRNNALYYAAEAFGDGEGGFSPTGGHVSEVLAKTTDLGDHWTSTLVENNRGKPEPAAADYGAALAVDPSGKADVVYVGYNQHFPTAAPDSRSSDSSRSSCTMLAI